jgi:5-formaminoimidazole-4-carboxamide-1-beta-D-ribofuranosyl 5'-monophosphate synthetase
MTDLEEVEIQIKMAREMIALRDAYVKLSSNKHFKDVIETGYFKEEAARLVMAKSASLTDEQQAKIDGMIMGVGALANYFDMIMRRGHEMEIAIGDHEQTREEILAEEASS